MGAIVDFGRKISITNSDESFVRTFEITREVNLFYIRVSVKNKVDWTPEGVNVEHTDECIQIRLTDKQFDALLEMLPLLKPK